MIYPVSPGDVPGLVELCRLHASYENAVFNESGQVERWSKAFFGKSPMLYGWVVKEPQSSILSGYMTATITFDTWSALPYIYMDTLYLREDSRSKGYGRELVKTLLDFAHREGIAELQWQTPPSNISGIAFYKRVGATSLDKVRFFHRG